MLPSAEMSEANVAAIRAAFAAYQAGDIDAVVALFHPDVHWNGPERGHLWWKRAPS